MYGAREGSGLLAQENITLFGQADPNSWKRYLCDGKRCNCASKLQKHVVELINWSACLFSLSGDWPHMNHRWILASKRSPAAIEKGHSSPAAVLLSSAWVADVLIFEIARGIAGNNRWKITMGIPNRDAAPDGWLVNNVLCSQHIDAPQVAEPLAPSSHDGVNNILVLKCCRLNMARISIPLDFISHSNVQSIDLPSVLFTHRST